MQYASQQTPAVIITLGMTSIFPGINIPNPFYKQFRKRFMIIIYTYISYLMKVGLKD